MWRRSVERQDAPAVERPNQAGKWLKLVSHELAADDVEDGVILGSAAHLAQRY